MIDHVGQILKIHTSDNSIENYWISRITDIAVQVRRVSDNKRLEWVVARQCTHGGEICFWYSEEERQKIAQEGADKIARDTGLKV